MTPPQLEALLEEALNPPKSGKPPRLRQIMLCTPENRDAAKMGERLAVCSHRHQSIEVAHPMMVLPCF